MVSPRNLVLFERRFGFYGVAGASFSHGDVVGFVDGAKQGIVIVDTCGHLKEYGDSMASFLKDEIESGWGTEGNSLEELLKLGDHLGALQHPKRDPLSKSIYDERWFEFVSAEYVQLGKDELSLSVFGGLGPTVIVRHDGSVEELGNQNPRVDRWFPCRCRPSYEVVLGDGEVMFLQSDGLYFNAADFLDTVDLSLRHILRYGLHKGVSGIRDDVLGEFSRFMSDDPWNDDVTFAVIKRLS